MLLAGALLSTMIAAGPAHAGKAKSSSSHYDWLQDYTLTDCRELVVNRSADPDDLALELPDGWQYYLVEEQPVLFSYAWECDRDAKTVREVFEMVRVEAPAEDLGGEGFFAFVLLHGHTNTWRNWLQWRSWGFDSMVTLSPVWFRLSPDKLHGSATAWTRHGPLRLRTEVTEDFISDIPGGTSAVFRLDGKGDVRARAYWSFSTFTVGPGEASYARGKGPLQPTGPGGAVFFANEGEDYTYTFSESPPTGNELIRTSSSIMEPVPS